MVYFTADTHFSDENIILYENRPFENAVKMDKELILKWNGIVSNNDTVYILGDFGAQGSESLLLSQLKGEKYLVKGNHDSNTNAYYREAGFKEVYDFPIITRGFWILSHEPLYVNENMPYANIFGHVHNSPLYKTYSRHHYCVSVERTNYAPISFDEIISKITGI